MCYPFIRQCFGECTSLRSYTIAVVFADVISVVLGVYVLWVGVLGHSIDRFAISFLWSFTCAIQNIMAHIFS